MNTIPIERLQEVLRRIGRPAIALSGGLDSSVLLATAVNTLGASACKALMISTPYVMQEESSDAHALCTSLGVDFETITLPIPESVKNNPPLRCYYCKRELFSTLIARATALGCTEVIDGSNINDLGDYRPGRKALAELGVRSPYIEAGFNKEAIRILGRQLGLPTEITEKPAYACLMTRLEHDTPVTPEILHRIDEAETYLRKLGLTACRVRVHQETLARIELPRAVHATVLAHAEEITRRLKELGFRYVSLDLGGYQQGNMNQPI